MRCRMAKAENGVRRARDAALKYLGVRAHTVRELREKLLRKRFPETVVVRVIEELENLRLLDDDQFARTWVETRQRTRPVGSARLEEELRRKGIDETVIARVLEEFRETLDTPDEAVSLLRRQKWRYAGLEEKKAKRRMWGFLARRGYPQEAMRRAIDKVWEDLKRNEVERD